MSGGTFKGNVGLLPGERIDDLQRNGYGIIQSGKGFCFGMDAVLLSGFAKVKKGETAADLCTGTGIIPILLSAKTPGKFFYGVEIQPYMAGMAARSVKLNSLEEKISIICGDIRELKGKALKEAGSPAAALGNKAGTGGEAGTTGTRAVPPQEMEGFGGVLEEVMPACGSMEELKALCGRVDAVTCNPPYMKVSHGLKNPQSALAIARHEITCTLANVCTASSRLLKSGGRFYLVHRPLRLAEIFEELRKARLEPKRMKPVYPYADREATMVLIEAVKDAAPECRMEKPIIVYKEPGVYTDEIYEIYGY